MRSARLIPAMFVERLARNLALDFFQVNS